MLNVSFVEADPKATLYYPRRQVGAEAMVSRESVGLHLVFTPKSESDLGCAACKTAGSAYGGSNPPAPIQSRESGAS